MANYRLLPGALKAWDVFAMLIGFAIGASGASADVTYTTIEQFLELRLSVGNAVLVGALMIFWHSVFTACGLYDGGLRARRYGVAIDLCKAVAISVIGVVMAGVLFSISFVDAEFVLLFTGVSLALLLASRIAVGELHARKKRNERHRPKLLIVGVNPRSIRFAQELDRHPDLSHDLIGFVDDHGPHLPRLEDTSYKLITDIDHLLEYLRRTPVDEVVMCLPLKSHYDNAARIVSQCEEQGITVRIIADLFQFKLSHSRAEQFGGTSVITLRTHGIIGLPAVAKRAIDIGVSGAMLVALSPLFLIAAVLVVTTSSGPVFFRQERIGLNKKTFKMIKFRTMVVDAELKLAGLEALNEATGPAFKIKADPRITSVGKALRKTSVDELPQLINVFLGDMSLVGPRPLPLRDYAGFSEDWHRRRVSVRPGITCLWQIGGRDHSSFENWMKLDMQYIDQWSLLLDLKILLKTVPAVLKGTGD